MNTKPSTEQITDKVTIVEERNPKGEVVEKYVKGRFLGKGGFAKCYEFTTVESKKIYAAKIICKASLTKNRAKQKLMSEIKIHRSLHHAHIVGFQHFFEDNENVYILLEMCTNQTLNELIRRRKRLTELEVQCYLQQILSALKYLHNHRVIHRDLKLGNLFLSEKMEIKIGDFGLATKLEYDGERKRTICGTPNYIAPEILEGKNGHSYEVDTWSLGVIIYTLLIGKPPFETSDVKTTYRRIRMNAYSFPDHVQISSQAKSLITKILNSDPAKRPSLDAILASDFLNMGGTIPKLLPVSTLACPPSASYVKQFLPSTTKEREPSTGRLSPKRLESTAPVSLNNQRASLKERKDFINTDRATLVTTPTNGGSTNLDNPINMNGNNSTNTPHTNHQMTNFNIIPKLESGNSLRGSIIGENQKVLRTESKESCSPIKVENPLTSRNFCEKTDRGLYSSTNALKTKSLSGNFTQKLENVSTTPINNNVTGADIWVKRWVDYSSKYGLGYLLSNGYTGVFFNDSTKILLEAKGSKFIYVERKGAEKQDFITEHTLSNYPKDLQKKVTLLQHFKSYLEGEEQKNGGQIDDEPKYDLSDFVTVYVKKWMRTKHAIMFRMSSKVVQVIFQDQTEIILSSELKVVTYVNKKHERLNYPLSTALQSSNQEMAKRLKYTKDILTHMLGGGQGGNQNLQKDENQKSPLTSTNHIRPSSSNRYETVTLSGGHSTKRIEYSQSVGPDGANILKSGSQTGRISLQNFGNNFGIDKE